MSRFWDSSGVTSTRHFTPKTFQHQCRTVQTYRH